MHVLLKIKYVCVLTDNFFEMGCINELTISSWLNKTKEKNPSFSMATIAYYSTPLF